MITLEELPAQLTLISKSDWADLFKHLPGLRAAKDKELNKAIDGLVEQAYYMQLIVNFDWTKWTEGKALLNTPDTDYSALDAATLCKLLTVVVRGDRFTEGSLKARVKEGILEKIVEGLKNKFG